MTQSSEDDRDWDLRLAAVHWDYETVADWSTQGLVAGDMDTAVRDIAADSNCAVHIRVGAAVKVVHCIVGTLAVVVIVGDMPGSDGSVAGDGCDLQGYAVVGAVAVDMHVLSHADAAVFGLSRHCEGTRFALEAIDLVRVTDSRNGMAVMTCR